MKTRRLVAFLFSGLIIISRGDFAGGAVSHAVSMTFEAPVAVEIFRTGVRKCYLERIREDLRPWLVPDGSARLTEFLTREFKDVLGTPVHSWDLKGGTEYLISFGGGFETRELDPPAGESPRLLKRLQFDEGDLPGSLVFDLTDQLGERGRPGSLRKSFKTATEMPSVRFHVTEKGRQVDTAEILLPPSYDQGKNRVEILEFSSNEPVGLTLDQAKYVDCVVGLGNRLKLKTLAQLDLETRRRPDTLEVSAGQGSGPANTAGPYLQLGISFNGFQENRLQILAGSANLLYQLGPTPSVSQVEFKTTFLTFGRTPERISEEAAPNRWTPLGWIHLVDFEWFSDTNMGVGGNFQLRALDFTAGAFRKDLRGSEVMISAALSVFCGWEFIAVGPVTTTAVEVESLKTRASYRYQISRYGPAAVTAYVEGAQSWMWDPLVTTHNYVKLQGTAGVEVQLLRNLNLAIEFRERAILDSTLPINPKTSFLGTVLTGKF